jgi:hypothetical protein
MTPEDRERQINEAVRDMLRYLNDLATIEDKYEALDRLEAWLAMLERSALPERMANQ